MTADPTPAADPRLAQIAERVAEGKPIDASDVAIILALLPARTATSEAEALAAAVERLRAAITPEHSHAAIMFHKDGSPFIAVLYPYEGDWQQGVGTTLPDAIAAALAATGGSGG